MTMHATQQPAAGSLPPVLLLREGAAYARVAPSLLREEVRRGRLRAVRIGGGTERRHIRFLREDFLAWLHSCSHGGNPTTQSEGVGPRPVAAGPARRTEA